MLFVRPKGGYFKSSTSLEAEVTHVLGSQKYKICILLLNTSQCIRIEVKQQQQQKSDYEASYYKRVHTIIDNLGTHLSEVSLSSR